MSKVNAMDVKMEERGAAISLIVPRPEVDEIGNLVKTLSSKSETQELKLNSVIISMKDIQKELTTFLNSPATLTTSPEPATGSASDKSINLLKEHVSNLEHAMSKLRSEQSRTLKQALEKIEEKAD